VVACVSWRACSMCRYVGTGEDAQCPRCGYPTFTREATEWEIFAGHTLTHTEAQELRDRIETIVKHEARK
jgi:RNA polymerase subunit RPABC4/transcription elongation factor Spt4